MHPLPPNIQSRRVVFSGKQQVHLEDFELPPIKNGEVLVRSQFSLMSTGTENIVFNRLFDPGTHWDHWVKYPFCPGYSVVGIVEASNDSSLKPGDHVAMRLGHQSHSVVEASKCALIPNSIPLEQAAWFALAKIAFMGARAADYRLGDSVLIIGAGPIGQMSVRWAAAAGAESIIVVDPVAGRLELARKGGATAVVSAPIGEARAAILDANNGKLPKIVVDSTGNAQVFSQALLLAADRGKVVILGDTGSPASQCLNPDVIMRGLTIVGAHDGHSTAEWDDITISRLFFSLVARGRVSLTDMNTHYFKPEACADAYATANRERAKTMGIIFDWRNQ